MLFREQKFKIFFLFIILSFFTANIQVQAADKYFDFQIRKNAGSFVVETSVLGGELHIAKDAYLEGGYEMKLLSFDGEAIESAFFDFQINKAELRLSYFDNIKEAAILKDGKLLHSENIAYFSNVCGDGECQAHESREICAEDCPSGASDGYCDKEKDGICDPDCRVLSDDADCESETGIMTSIIDGDKNAIKKALIFFLLSIFVLILVLSLAYFFKKRNEKSTDFRE